MANETPRLKIIYPSLGESNYFDNYQAGMNDIDAGIFAAWSAINTIVNGGGTVTWDLVGSDYTLAWTDAIAFQTPAFGVTQSVALGSIVIPQGLLIYTDLSFGATVGSTALTFTVASQSPVDTASNVFAWHNPATHALHFATGLVLALGGTATGVQPQGGGGGGSISVTDGTTTVNPTTAIDFTAGAVVTDGGGGNADVLIPLTTQFVVAQDGTGLFTAIQDGIDAANAAWGASGVDQIVFVRGGDYTENLTFKTGVRVIAEGNPNAKPDDGWIGTLDRTPTSAVIVTGQHQFEIGVRLRTTIQGITFVTAGSTLFSLSDTTAASWNTIQFFDCLLVGDSMPSATYLFEVNSKDCPNLSLHFERCRLLFLSNLGGAYAPMVLFGSNGTNQDYTFVDCLFDTKGYTGRVVFQSDSGTGAGETRFTRCKFFYADLDTGSSYNPFNSDLWLTDVVIDGPERWPVTWFVGASIYVTRCTLGSALGGGYETIITGGAGLILFDNLTYYPSYVTSTTRIAEGQAVATYAIPARSIEGGTYGVGGTGTVDLDAEWTTGQNFTNVSWDTTIGGVGTRVVQLHDAAKTQGMYFTVWDSGGMANSRNIVVTSPATAGGVVGPHTTIANADGSLTFVATVDSGSQACWRSISYFY